MNKIATLVIAATAWLLTVPASASEDSFNQAVNLYLKGYADCREANTLRSEDLTAARTYFDRYLATLDQAAAIDPEILKTNARDMNANLKYCERVQVNLKMAEAAPVLEQGFEHCEKAKSAFDSKDFTIAQQEMVEYGVKRDQAFAITESIMEVFNLASQVRSCARFQEKLVSAKQATQAETAALLDAQQLLQAFNEKCNYALSYTRQTNFTVDTLSDANEKLSDALHYKKQAHANTLAFKAAEQQPDREESKAIKKLDEVGTRCETEVSSQIRNMTKQRRVTEKTLEDAIANLQQAAELCKSARKLALITPATDRTLNQAQASLQKMGPFLFAGDTAAIAALNSRHPQWPQSKRWEQLKGKTGRCQQEVSGRISTQRDTMTAIKENSISEAIAQQNRQTSKETAESVAPPSEISSAIPEANNTVSNAPSAAGVEETQHKGNNASADRKASANAGPTSSRKEGDWTELVGKDASNADDAALQKKQLRKSWTDLVQ